MTSELGIKGCTSCRSPFIKTIQNHIFRCEMCGWKGELQSMRGENAESYYMDLIKNKTASAERVSELMCISVSEVMDIMKKYGLLKLHF